MSSCDELSLISSSDDDLSLLKSSSEESLLSDDSLIDDSDEWGEEEWEGLLGSKEAVERVVQWMAKKCPGNELLHTNSLRDDHSYNEQRYKVHEKLLWDAFRHILREDCLKFEEKRKEYEEEIGDSILTDFFLTYRQPWMVVGHEDLRPKMRTLKDQDNVYNLAKIHRLISMADRNMTEITSQILDLEDPDPFWIYHGLRDMDLSDPRGGSYENFGMNLGCARDVANHLIKTLNRKSKEE